MIHGTKNPLACKTVRNHLLDSPFTFILTGSRFFGNHNENSDWDFFTQESPEVEKFLKELGFKKLSFTDYKDQMTSSVCRLAPQCGNCNGKGTILSAAITKRCSVCEGYGTHRPDSTTIDIQFVKDADLKLKAQNWIDSLPTGHSLKNQFMDRSLGSKGKKDLLWDFVFCSMQGILAGESHGGWEDGPGKPRPVPSPNYNARMVGFIK